MEQDRRARDREQGEAWGAAEVPPAGEEWGAGGSEQGENASVPIAAIGFPMRSEKRAMI